MATAAELSDELERTRTRLAAVTAAGDALYHCLKAFIRETGALGHEDAALTQWRAVTTT